MFAFEDFLAKWISLATPASSHACVACNKINAEQNFRNSIEMPYATNTWSYYRVCSTTSNHVCAATESAAQLNPCRFTWKVQATKQRDRALLGFLAAPEHVLFLPKSWKQGIEVQTQSSPTRTICQYMLSVVELDKPTGEGMLSGDGGGLSENRIWMAEDQVKTLRSLAGPSEMVEDELKDELEVYVTSIKRAMSMPFGSKPDETHWQLPDSFSRKTKALKDFACATCLDDSEEHQIACEVLNLLGMSKSPAAALDVLIGMGVFSLHVNLDLLKSGRRAEFPEEIVATAHALRFKAFSDEELKNRADLTNLKVYCIDPEDTDEIDDGVSATLLGDGGVKLWVHVADPTSWITPGNSLEKEARRRCTSIYLPTHTLPMFPMDLVTDCLSFRQGAECFALSTCITLKEDGSIADSKIMHSIIRPTYMMSYHQASELIFMKLEEEKELSLLSRAATLRRQWRKSQGATNLSSYPPKVKVTNADSLNPSISIDIPDPTNAAVELVAEMMILCGEAVSMFGYQNSLVLPYRGQLWGNLCTKSPCPDLHNLDRSISMRQDFGPVDVNLRRPLAHLSLGLAGYVQFTSPIRRYNDILAHYQVKAALQGHKPQLSLSNMAAAVGWANKIMREAKALEFLANRYWILEHLRRQPRDKVYRADILYFKKDKQAVVLLKEVAFEAAISIYSKADVGSEVKVMVKEAQPRKGILILMEVP